MFSRCRSLLVASFFAMGIASSTAFGATATQSGNWSDASTWGGSPPSGVEEDVTIPMGVTVTLDTDDEVGEIMVNGALVVAAADLALTCDSLIVMGSSALFEVGTDAARFTNDFVLTLKGEISENFVHSMGGENHDMGARALLALMGGIISMHGEDRVEWTVLNADVAAGSSSITVADAVDWRPGDKILLVSSTTDWNEAEELTVASVTGGGTVVNLTSNLSYWHSGTVQQYTRPSDSKTWTADMRAEVGLLTRNIVIQGASDSVGTGFGAHVMVHGPMQDGAMTHPSGYAYIKGIEIYRGGQESILGRYPFHWHLVQDSGAGQYFNDSSIHDSFNRGVTIHGTDFTTVSNNFMYKVIGHTLFLEDGVEENNTITYNVVCLTLRPAPGTETTPSDNQLNEGQNRTPASYWITHPNNIVDFNVAAGGEGTGFWYIFPRERIGPSANLTYYDTATIAHYAPLGSFYGNTAHSYMNGWDIFDSLDADHSIKKNTGWDNATDHVFDSALWYANDTALYTGTGTEGSLLPVKNVIKRDNIIVDNTHASMLASSTTIEESVFVARSGLPLNPDLRRLGHRLYDGAPDFNDCYWVGWDGPLPYTSLVTMTGGATQRVNWGFSGVETDHPGTNMSMSLPDFDFGDAWYASPQSIIHPRTWENVFSDADGSLTGLADSSLVANHPWYFTGSETPYAGSQNIYHVPHKFARITQQKSNKGGANHIFTREKSGTPTEAYFHALGSTGHNSFAAIVNEDFEYSITFWETQSYNPAEWEMWDAEPGDVAIVKFNHMDNVTGLVPTGTAYSSVADIFDPASTTTGHYLDGNGVLWFRVIADANGYRAFGFSWSGGSAAYVYNGSDDLDLDGRTNDAEGGPNLDTDGNGLPDYADSNNDSDSMSDKDELFYGLDPESTADLRYEFGEHGGDGFDATIQRDNVDGAFEFVYGGTTNPNMTLAGQADIFLVGDDIDTMTIRYKSDTSFTLRFTWWKLDGTSSLVYAPAYTGGSGWTEHTFDLSGNADWAGQNIIRLRLGGPEVIGAVTSVDWIRANGQGDLPGGGGGGSDTFTPTDDAEAREVKPTTNYGSASYIPLRYATGSSNREGYLKFNVSGTSGTITNATLRLYQVGSSQLQATSAHVVSDTSWTEGALTWNNRPAMGATLDTVTTPALNDWFELDVTSHVTGDGLVSIGLTDTVTGTNNARVSTKEGSFIPELVVTYSDSGNNAPVFTNDSMSEADATEGSAYSQSIAGTATDADSDPLTYSKASGPAWLSVASGGALSGTPGAGDVGANTFTIQVSDGTSLDMAVLNIDVLSSSGGNAPVFPNDSILEPDALEDSAYSQSIAGAATDADSDPLSYSILSGPLWLNVSSGGALTGTPGIGDVGANSWTVEVSDGSYTDTATLSIYVDNLNDAPVFTNDPVVEPNAMENIIYLESIAGSATDADGDGLIYEILSGPSWLDISASGALLGEPFQSDAGLNQWTVEVSDGVAADTATLNITVDAVNDAPTFTHYLVIGDRARSGVAYLEYYLQDVTDDAEGDTLSYSKISGPAWLTVASSGVVSGTPGVGDVGLNQWTIQVDDGNGGTDTTTLSITVVDEAVTLVAADFEAGMDGFIDPGADCRRDIADAAWAYSGSYCIRLRDDAPTPYVTSPIFDASGYGQITIDHWYVGDAMGAGESYLVQYSSDGGSNWTTVAEYLPGTDFTNQTFENSVIVLDSGSYSLTSSAQVRFRCNGDGNADRIYVDDVLIIGE